MGFVYCVVCFRWLGRYWIGGVGSGGWVWLEDRV